MTFTTDQVTKGISSCRNTRAFGPDKLSIFYLKHLGSRAIEYLTALFILDHLKFYVVCINGRRYVCCGECYVVSNECDELTSCLVQYIGAHCCEAMYFGCFGFRGELGFRNCDICMCVVNKQFQLLEFLFDSVYVDHQYDEISLTFAAGSVCLCGVCRFTAMLVWGPGEMWLR